jgi:hypothetical protein
VDLPAERRAFIAAGLNGVAGARSSWGVEPRRHASLTGITDAPSLEDAVDAYVHDRIDVDELERRVERVLRAC